MPSKFGVILTLIGEFNLAFKKESLSSNSKFVTPFVFGRVVLFSMSEAPISIKGFIGNATQLFDGDILGLGL